MDEKKSEIRRKKMLEKAEARLRFIKEGVPWRNNESQNSDTQSNVILKDEGERQSTVEECTGANQSTTQDMNELNIPLCRYNHVDLSPVKKRLNDSVSAYMKEVVRYDCDMFEDESLFNVPPNRPTVTNETTNYSEIQLEKMLEGVRDYMKEVVRYDFDMFEDKNLFPTRLSVTNETTNDSESIIKDDEVITNGFEVVTNEAEEETSRLSTSDEFSGEILENDTEGKADEREMNETAEVVTEAMPHRSIDRPGLIPDDLVRNIKALLCDSTSNREEQKRRSREMNANIWTSVLIMLCLGMCTRICYAVGLAWLFKEVMLVPFMTVAVVRLVPMVLNPPAPSGPLVQFLLMVGVRFKLLSQVFTVVSLFRMFLQLFSMFLIAFVFTHQVFETFFV